VAETVLRQNGYDVIAVTAAEKAREVLELSKPDLVIVGADLAAPDGSPYYEKLQQDPKTSAMPMLLFERSDKGSLDLPDEVVIPRPFEPKDFLHKVSVFLGSADAPKPAQDAASGEAEINDEFLDAALGIDQLDVTDSEVMDKTVMGKRRRKGHEQEKLLGLEGGDEFNGSDTGGATVESLVIDEDSSQVRHQRPGRTAPKPDGTGKLDILPDQYGLSEASALEDDSDGVHDYDWFVDAMRDDHDPAATTSLPGASDTGSITISDPSAAVDPVTPGPAPARKVRRGSSPGVEKFIDEFKKEMEQIRTDEIEEAVSATAAAKMPDKESELGWEEKLEKMGPAQIDLFAKEFARELGQKVAQIIAAKIDSDKLLRLIKSELVERARKGK
jgi:DNA-binding response OmpR family regulator